MLLLNLAIFRYGFCRDLASMTSGPQACNFIKKETQVSVFSCEFCEITKNSFFHRTSLVATSEFPGSDKSISSTCTALAVPALILLRAVVPLN